MRIGNIVAPNSVFGSRMESFDGLRIGVIGAGKMAELHLKVLESLDGVRLVGICNRSSEKGLLLAERFKIDSVYKDADELVDEAKPDAVVITVSHSETVDVTARMLRRRIPCLIEKPAGLCVEETLELAKLAEATDCYNMVALNRRFYSGINLAHLALLHYGPIRGIMVEAHEPIQKMRNRLQFNSSLYDRWLTANTIHAVDLFRMLGGEVDELTSYSESQAESFGDTFSAGIKFKRGGSGVFASYWNSAGGMALKLFGNGVSAQFDALETGFLNYADGRRVKIEIDEVDRVFKPGLYDQMTRFLQDVKDGRGISYPASDLKDNVGTMKLLERIQGKCVAANEPVAN